MPSRDFITGLDEKSLQNIREYIERRLIKIFDILRTSEIRLFYYTDSKNLFEEDLIEIVPGVTRTIFNFIKETNGSRYFLSINDGKHDIKLSDQPGEIICNSPCILLASHRLYFFDSGDKGIDGKKLLPFFIKDSIIIPKTAEKKYFETFVKNALENYDVNAVGFDVNLQKHQPTPFLIFENDWKNEFVVILKFEYNGKMLSYNYDKKAFVDFHYKEGNFYFSKTIRNTEFEENKRGFLLSFPEIEEQNECIYKIKSNDGPVQNILNWINLNSEQIIENGFVIKQNFKDRKYFTRTFSIEFKLKDGHDWFDLYAIVHFGEFSFPFIALKNNLLKNIKEYMLPNGEIVILPNEWFQKYSSFFKFGKSTEGNLRLKKHHLNYFFNELAEIDRTLVEKLVKLEQTDYEQPKGLKASFRPYQRVGYNWIYSLYKNKLGVCLADDMGLGKTLQTLAAILKFNESTTEIPIKKAVHGIGKQLSIFDKPVEPETVKNLNVHKTGIIVMPTSLIHNWVNEIQKFAPNLKYYVYTGSRRIKDISEFDAYHLVLTSYGILRNDIDLLKDYYYHFVILDESQFVKNPSSKIYQSVLELQSGFKMVLTGTPIENSLGDLWAQLNFINPDCLAVWTFSEKNLPIQLKEWGMRRIEKTSKKNCKN